MGSSFTLVVPTFHTIYIFFIMVWLCTSLLLCDVGVDTEAATVRSSTLTLRSKCSCSNRSPPSCAPPCPVRSVTLHRLYTHHPLIKHGFPRYCINFSLFVFVLQSAMDVVVRPPKPGSPSYDLYVKVSVCLPPILLVVSSFLQYTLACYVCVLLSF